jgi:hypothetical protein
MMAGRGRKRRPFPRFSRQTPRREWSDSWVTHRTGDMGDSPANSVTLSSFIGISTRTENDLSARSPFSLIAVERSGIRTSAKIRLHCGAFVVCFI